MDLDSVCRICLLGKTLVEGEILVSLSSIDEKNEVLSEKIMSCTDVQITDEDILPMQICVTCIDNLDVAYRFKKQCEENDFTLRQCLVESVVIKDSAYVEHTYNTKDNQLTSYVDDNWTFQNSPGDNKNSENAGDSCSDVSVRVVNAVASSKGLVIRKDDLDNAIGDLPGLQVLEKSNGLSTGTNIIQNYLKDRIQSIYNRNELSSDVDTDVIKIEVYEESSSEAETASQVVVAADENRLREMSAGVVGGSPRKRFQHSAKSQACFVCKVCGKVFKSNMSLQGHERRHTGERPFMCQVCGKSFHVVNELKKHSLVHSGLKPYQCRHCSRSFSDWGSRFKHERCHSGERPYKCEECGKCFTYACVLAKHKLTHSGVKNFSCSVCDKNFTLKFHLTNHNRKYHPIKEQHSDLFTPLYLEDDSQDFKLSLNSEVKIEVD